MLLILLSVFCALPLTVQADFEAAETANHNGDRERAFSGYRAAALAGDSRAFGKLGGMYLYGSGTSKDYAMAYVWFGLAHEAGDKYGERFQATAAAAMPSQQIQQARALLDSYRSKLGLSQTPIGK